MKKMLRKLIAVMMAMSLCIGIIALPTAAEEAPQTEQPSVSVTVDITDGSGNVIGTSTTTTTTTDDGNGNTGSTTTIITTTTEGNTTQTDTDSTWESTRTDTDSGSSGEIDDNVDQSTQTSTTTQVEGSSQSQDTAVKDGNDTHYSGSESGSETTTVITTTTTTTTTEDTLLDTDVDTPEVPSALSEGEYGIATTTAQGDWVRDPDNDYTDTSWETLPDTESSAKKEDVTIELPDPLDKTDVTLNLKPNNQWVRKSISIDLEDLIPKEGEQKDGSIVQHIKDKDGNVTGYTVTRYGSETVLSDDEDIQETGTTDPTWTTVEEDKAVAPPEYPSTAAADDTTTVLVETVTDKDGNVTGYKVTTTQVETAADSSNLTGRSSDSADAHYNGHAVPADATSYGTNGYIQLPTRPKESSVTDADGNTTTVTVEEITDGNGVTIGYKAITTVTDSEGNLRSRSSETEYGILTTFASRTELDPNTSKTTTVTEQIITGLQDTQTAATVSSGTQDVNITRMNEQDIYQLVETETGLVFIYQGKMYQVQGTSTRKASTEVATDDTVDMNGYKSSSDGGDLRYYGDQLSGGSEIKDYYTGQEFKEQYHDRREDGTWRHIGYGLFSDFTVQETNGTGHSTKQFMIQDGDEIRYVYCVELGAGINAGSSYGSTEYKDTTSDNQKHPWRGADGTMGELRSVALNGFWGTEEGLGSLEAVKDLLRRNGYNEEADILTAGMALTATQVAIWEFGARSGGKFGGEDYNFVTWDDGEGEAPDEKSQNAIVTLRDLLVKLAKDPSGEGQAETIDKSDITGGAITVKEKVSEDASGTGTYNTDLSFTLDVSTSSINGDLVVKVLVGGKEIGKARLAGEEDSSLFKWGKIYPDANGTYTIKDVELAEGVKVDLQLTGTQHLDDGVYVFKGEGSMQDFIGLSKLEQDVDITVSMEFNVTEPEDPSLSHTERKWSEGRTNQLAYTRTNSLARTRTGTKKETAVTVTTELYGTETQTDVITSITKQERDWESYYAYTLTTTTTQDKDVPTADAPRTGDTTLILALISLFSGSGLLLLNRKKEEE